MKPWIGLLYCISRVSLQIPFSQVRYLRKRIDNLVLYRDNVSNLNILCTYISENEVEKCLQGEG